MTVRELLIALLDCPQGARVYIGKGMGPLYASGIAPIDDNTLVILTPVRHG